VLVTQQLSGRVKSQRNVRHTLGLLHLQDVKKAKNFSILFQSRRRNRPAPTVCLAAGYSCSLMTTVTESSSTVAGTATARDSVMPRETSGSATSIFISWLKFSTTV